MAHLGDHAFHVWAYRGHTGARLYQEDGPERRWAMGGHTWSMMLEWVAGGSLEDSFGASIL